jgi:mRNA interferase MazF
MRDVHPFLVLSPRLFNGRTSVVIGLPMTTAQYNADNPFAVAVGTASGRKAGQPDSLFGQVCDRLNQIIVLG